VSKYKPAETPPTGERSVGRLLQFLLGIAAAIALLLLLEAKLGFQPPEIEPNTPDRVPVKRSGYPTHGYVGGPKHGNVGDCSSAYEFSEDDPLIIYDVQGCQYVYLSVSSDTDTEAYADVWCKDGKATKKILVDRDGDGRVE
jgi:hypothetical protein